MADTGAMMVNTWNLRSIQSEQPRCFIGAMVATGGGANLYGPFKTRKEAKEFGPTHQVGADFAEAFGCDEWRIYPIDEAVAQFCDDDYGDEDEENDRAVAVNEAIAAEYQDVEYREARGYPGS